jgi:hypothetical protein
MNEQLTKIGTDLVKDIDSITNVIGVKKGTRLLFKTLKNDQITFTNCFGNSWDSGVQLIFNVIDDRLVYATKGAFGWRSESYNTPENNKTLANIISKIESKKIK